MSKRAATAAVLAATAVPFAAADLLVKAYVPTPNYAFHSRPSWQLAVGLGLAVSLSAIVVAVGSAAVAAAAGVAVGGTIGNLASVAIWGAAPNPFLILHGGRGIAFNLADVLVLAGAWLIAVAAGAHARANRHRLQENFRQI